MELIKVDNADEADDMRILKTLAIAMSRDATGQIFLRASATFVFLALLACPIAGQEKLARSELSFGASRGIARIEVFYDLQCGACVPFHERLKKVVEQFPGRVFVTVRHYPLPTHDNAFISSSAVEAASKHGKGIEMMEILLRNREQWAAVGRPLAIFERYAKELGLDVGAFRTDVFTDDVIRSVLCDLDRGKRMGVTATPSMFLNSRLLEFRETFEMEKLIQKVFDSEVN